MFGGFYFQKNSIFDVENTDPQKERKKESDSHDSLFA